MTLDRNLANGIIPLPKGDSHCKLHLLDGGSFIASESRLHANVQERFFRLYNWAFLITASDSRHVLWDYGMSSNRDLYTPWVQKFMIDVSDVSGPAVPITEQLQRRGVDPHDAETVIFSHAHWDHCCPIRDHFPSVTAYFGPGTASFCSPGHFLKPGSQWDGRFFDPEKHTENWKALSGPWVRFGQFEHAMDFFGDGSFWVIRAPGHMAGNLCAAVRVRVEKESWEDSKLFDGVHDIACWKYPDGSESSLQEDIPAARDTIARTKYMEEKFKADVAFAHDVSWMMKGQDKVLFSLLDSETRRSVSEAVVNNGA